jgi:hypothetical protein
VEIFRVFRYMITSPTNRDKESTNKESLSTWRIHFQILPDFLKKN